MIALPNVERPVMVRVCSVQRDGSRRTLANLLTAPHQARLLLSDRPNSVRESTVRNLATAFSLDEPELHFIPSDQSAVAMAS
jgi:hypothetical protein